MQQKPAASAIVNNIKEKYFEHWGLTGIKPEPAAGVNTGWLAVRRVVAPQQSQGQAALA